MPEVSYAPSKGRLPVETRYADISPTESRERFWVILTDRPLGEWGVSWYAPRFWIELGFKVVKSAG